MKKKVVIEFTVENISPFFIENMEKSLGELIEELPYWFYGDDVKIEKTEVSDVSS